MSAVVCDSNQDVKSPIDNKIQRKGKSAAFYQRLLSVLLLIITIWTLANIYYT